MDFHPQPAAFRQIVENLALTKKPTSAFGDEIKSWAPKRENAKRDEKVARATFFRRFVPLDKSASGKSRVSGPSTNLRRENLAFRAPRQTCVRKVACFAPLDKPVSRKLLVSHPCVRKIACFAPLDKPVSGKFRVSRQLFKPKPGCLWCACRSELHKRRAQLFHPCACQRDR